MINVTIYRDKDGRYKGFVSRGHADYADEGLDIVCSAVSVLVIGTANSIEKLTDDRIVSDDSQDGLIKVDFPDGLDHDGDLLKAMQMNLQSIEESYSGHIKLNIEEV